MVGTLVGLVNLMFLLGDGDMTAIGRQMAIALMTTFYGVLLANLVFKPVAVKLERRTEEASPGSEETGTGTEAAPAPVPYHH